MTSFLAIFAIFLVLSKPKLARSPQKFHFLSCFFSDSCRARFLAERNTKPVQPPAAVAQSSSPPLSSSANVQIQSGILNPHCRIATSPASMEQALWLSRATAMLRVEEERRKHEHLKQTLLKYAPQVKIITVFENHSKSIILTILFSTLQVDVPPNYQTYERRRVAHHLHPQVLQSKLQISKKIKTTKRFCIL